MTNTRHVIVSDEEYGGLPYSKGLMAGSIMATGLPPARAFRVAEVIEERLLARPVTSLTRAELTEVARQVLRDEEGERYAEIYGKWETVRGLAKPVVILLGGATGVGKSTIATALASRLGITRVIPTDAVREVMRAMFSEELLPTLQSSSFDTYRVIKHPVPRDTDAVIAGFREQASAVAVGIEALIRRAVEEGTHLIIEGAHVVPGFLDSARYDGRAVVVPIMITVEDEELHRSHFVLRGAATASRPSERYLEHFDHIRRIHRYLASMATEHGVPVVPSYSFDATLATVIELVVSAAIDAVPDLQSHPDLPAGGHNGAAAGSQSN